MQKFILKIPFLILYLLEGVRSVARVSMPEEYLEEADFNPRLVRYDQRSHIYLFKGSKKKMAMYYKNPTRSSEYKSYAYFSLEKIIPKSDISTFCYTEIQGEPAVAIVTSDEKKLLFLKIADGVAEIYTEIILNSGKEGFTTTSMIYQNQKIFTFQRGEKSQVLKSWMPTSESPELVGFENEGFDWIFPLENSMMMICRSEECKIIQDSSFSEISSHTNIGPGNIRSILNHKASSSFLFGTDKASILVRPNKGGSTDNQKVIKFYNATYYLQGTINNMKAVEETDFVLAKAITFVYMINPKDYPEGESDAKYLLVADFGGYSGGIETLAIENRKASYAYTFSTLQKSFIRINLCGGFGCNECTDDYKDCVSCDYDLMKIFMPFEKDHECRSQCYGNLTTNKFDPPTHKCVDCVKRPWEAEHPITCGMTQNFSLIKAPDTHEDPYSSNSIEISFKNSSDSIQVIQTQTEGKFNWSKIFIVKLFFLFFQGELRRSAIKRI